MNPRRFAGLALMLAVASPVGPAAAGSAEDSAPTLADEPSAEATGDGAEGEVETIALDPAVHGEVIEIWDERPDKPFDRDTELRLTGAELARRGATDLADALELLPELHVREAGRGGRQIDIRGARRGSIKVLIDGIPVDDPFYGTFDISSIPVTDIVQIRVSASPSSPIDGTGGPGGVVEVHTRDAIGARLVQARLQGSSLPAADASVTGRAMLGAHLALRASASATVGARDFVVAAPDGDLALDEDRHAANAALRLEYRRGTRRVVTDLWAQHRGFVVPPGEDGTMQILVIDGESAARAGVVADDHAGGWRLQGRAYVHALRRDSRYFSDASLTHQVRREDLSAGRAGLAALANRPLGKTLHVIGSAVFDGEVADVEGFDGTRVDARASVGELAAGAQYEDGPYRLDVAGGLAVPVGIDASPWPELKVVARYRPVRELTIKLTGARKGRVPTLRERFRVDVGNEGLGPEQVTFGEVGVDLSPRRWLKVTVASYARDTNGMIRFDAGQMQLINLGAMIIRGVDAKVQVTPGGIVSGGAGWSFTDAHSAESGGDPLDFLPRHRADAWLGLQPGERWGGNLRLRYVGDSVDRGEVVPPYAVVDVAIYARLRGGLLGTARIDNAAGAKLVGLVGGVRAPGRVFRLALQGEWR